MWECATEMTKFMILSGESSVQIDLLMEDSSLCVLVRKGSKEECLSYINENF